MALAELFTGGDYGFSMRMDRGQPGGFFGATAGAEALLRERAHWLDADPGSYVTVGEGAGRVLEETVRLAVEWETLPRETARGWLEAKDSPGLCVGLGRHWEADFICLKFDDEGVPRLVAGCVCFPSSWSLPEKLGMPVSAIHGIVPGLNESVGRQIGTFLQRIKPGLSWERANWGLSRVPDLNQHPGRGLPRLDASVTAGEVWLRVEHQSLVALPASGGVLFGIRLAIHPLIRVLEEPEARIALAHKLRTMPEPMAVYKGLATAREAILALLEG